MKTLVCIFLLCLGLVLADPLPKQLAGPPSEFPDHVIPSPVQAALNQKSAFLKANFLEDGSKDFDLPVDSSAVFGFNFFSPAAQSFTLKLTDPKGNVVPLEGHEHPGFWPIGDSSNFEVPVMTFIFENPIVGVWKLTLTAQGLSNETRNSQYPNVAIMLFNESPIQAFAYLNDYKTEKGRDIGLVARVTDQTQWVAGSAPAALVGSITDAEMEVTLPDGSEIDVPMHDDGLHGDGAPLDGIYGATIKATESGQYLVTALLEGATSNGVAFLRSTEHLINVVDDPVELTGAGTGVGSSERIDLYLNVNKQSSSKYRAYAEVWGMHANGEETPICWIGSMVTVQTFQNQPTVRLELDLKWAAIANAKGPYVLKNAYLQEVSSFIPISQRSIIKISMSAQVDMIVSNILRKGVPTVTEEMLEGVRPPASYFYRNTTAARCSLIVTHGYCAGVNPWQQHAPDFSDVCYFLVKDANLLHDAYAMKIANYAADIPSWGGVGHSQGGLVMLHLHNHYWTGLANAKGNRLVQSVGSPYQGCTGAGNAANLIKIFGIACGANSDLTTDGSKLWLAGITANARKSVFYGTSTYVQGKLFGDYCNIAVNLVLQWPNDGTSELTYAQLPGGNNLGNKEKWCHTTEMAYPAQYTDTARNKDMNTHAAR